MCINCTKIKCIANELLHVYIPIKPPSGSRYRDFPHCKKLFLPFTIQYTIQR